MDNRRGKKMALIKSIEAEKKAVLDVACLMAASARTSPKARGVDTTSSLIVTGDDLEKLAATMEKVAKDKPDHRLIAYKRDAGNVRDSECVLLLGVKREPKKIEEPLDCGACGFAGCANLVKARKQVKDYSGPVCAFQSMDLGIALCSAVKVASELNIDNRIMYTIGVAAKKLGLLDADIIVAIPLSVSCKSPYFDR